MRERRLHEQTDGERNRTQVRDNLKSFTGDEGAVQLCGDGNERSDTLSDCTREGYLKGHSVNFLEEE